MGFEKQRQYWKIGKKWDVMYVADIIHFRQICYLQQFILIEKHEKPDVPHKLQTSELKYIQIFRD